MEKGVLYWITGLSGAGKTTIGTKLYYEMRKSCPGLVILDGDILKRWGTLWGIPARSV